MVGDAGLNLLINNAGVLHRSKRLDDVSVDDMRQAFETNTIGPLFFAKALLPMLKAAADAGSTKPMGVDRYI